MTKLIIANLVIVIAVASVIAVFHIVWVKSITPIVSIRAMSASISYHLNLFSKGSIFKIKILIIKIQFLVLYWNFILKVNTITAIAIAIIATIITTTVE